MVKTAGPPMNPAVDLRLFSLVFLSVTGFLVVGFFLFDWACKAYS